MYNKTMSRACARRESNPSTFVWHPELKSLLINSPLPCPRQHLRVPLFKDLGTNGTHLEVQTSMVNA